MSFLNLPRSYRCARQHRIELSHPGRRGEKLALPERRRMMQAWADYLDSLQAGGSVIPFRKDA